MTEASNTIELHENHERIWLSPRCDPERTWCQDDIGCCDECGEPTVEYVRADLYASQAEEIERRASFDDHALICWAMCVGAGRWEPWGDGRGEFCMNGLRHSTKLDEFGCPTVTDGMRDAIRKAQTSRLP